MASIHALRHAAPPGDAKAPNAQPTAKPSGMLCRVMLPISRTVLRRTSDSGVRRIQRESSASANSTSSPPSKNPPLHIRSGLCRRECADVSAGARSEKYDAASMMPAPSAISRFITLG